VGKPVRNNKTDASKYVSGVVALTLQRNDHLIQDHSRRISLKQLIIQEINEKMLYRDVETLW